MPVVLAVHRRADWSRSLNSTATRDHQLLKSERYAETGHDRPE